ncbi:hypothetical protein [Streptomyces sp. NPDC085529]|uniref:hypothetical protein n=1 Tax=Streptomyces sp. NPDC085529 TaxID=3365729 RepID=UPI0037D48265
MKSDDSLATVRRRRPERPAAWITPPTTVGAWVAERGGRPVGHVGPAGSREHDGAPGVWSAATGRGVDQAVMVNRLYVSPAATALYERLGWHRRATVAQEWGPRRDGRRPLLRGPRGTPSASGPAPSVICAKGPAPASFFC